MSKMPKQQPATSKQDYETPPELLSAIAKRFGPIVADLACTKENAKAPIAFTKDQDSLTLSWAKMCPTGTLFLNPEFGNITPFAKKCALESKTRHGLIVMLVPASIGANWFARHVNGQAMVLGLSPRVTFVGEEQGYPKDLMLCVYGYGLHGFDGWRWAGKSLGLETRTEAMRDADASIDGLAPVVTPILEAIAHPCATDPDPFALDSDDPPEALPVQPHASRKVRSVNGEPIRHMIQVSSVSDGVQTDTEYPACCGTCAAPQYVTAFGVGCANGHDGSAGSTREDGVKGDSPSAMISERDRDLVLKMGVRDGFLSAADMKRDAKAAWLSLQARAPVGWFRACTIPKDSSGGVNMSDLSAALTMRGIPVGLVELCSWAPERRQLAEDWVRGLNKKVNFLDDIVSQPKPGCRPCDRGIPFAGYEPLHTGDGPACRATSTLLPDEAVTAEAILNGAPTAAVAPATEEKPKRGKGRPPGSKNKKGDSTLTSWAIAAAAAETGGLMLEDPTGGDVATVRAAFARGEMP